MHVLQLGPYPPPEGGINRNILAIREELLAGGHRCSIIATSRSTAMTPEADVYHPRSALQLLRLLFKIKYDILHLHIGGDVTTRVLALILVCGVLGRTRSVFTLHSGGYPLTKEGKNAKTGTFRGLLFRRFARIIAVNPLIGEVFERYGVERRKIRVIYPFVHRRPDPAVSVPPALKAFAERHSPFLLTVGLLEDEYDLFMQIDALGKILGSFPEAGIMIVGSGSLEATLREAIAAKPYASNVFLTGDVEHRVTLHLINDADILLRTTIFDGDAISVREALFLETPVIATDNSMRPDGVQIIPVQDEKALIDEVLKWTRVENQPAAKADDKSNITEVVELYREVLSAG